MSSVVLVRQPSSGLVARSSAGNGIAVRDLHFQRRSVHKCSAGGGNIPRRKPDEVQAAVHGESRQVGRGWKRNGSARFASSFAGGPQLDAAHPRRMARFREEMARTVPPTTPPVSETTQP